MAVADPGEQPPGLELPGEGDVRVNEEFGGRVRAVETGDVGDLVMSAYDAMAERFGRPMDYIRVDLLRWDGDWVVSELELIEPGLYLDVEGDPWRIPEGGSELVLMTPETSRTMEEPWISNPKRYAPFRKVEGGK